MGNATITARSVGNEDGRMAAKASIPIFFTVDEFLFIIGSLLVQYVSVTASFPQKTAVDEVREVQPIFVVG